MSRLDIRIPPAMPDSLAPDQISSSDPYLAGRHVVEIRPHNDTDIVIDANSGQRQVEFVFSNPQVFLDNSQSFLECNVKVECTDDSVALNNLSLVTGGIHGLIKHARLYDEAGVLLDETAYYSTFYGAASNLLHTKAHVETYGSIWGDSVEEELLREKSMRPVQISYTSCTVAHVADTSALDLVGTGSRFTQDLAVGDLVYVFTAGVGAIGSVSAIASDTAATVISYYRRDTALSATACTVYRLTNGVEPFNSPVASVDLDLGSSSRRYLGKNGATNRVNFKLMMGFFSMKKLAPLRYMKNARLVIDFNQAWEAVHAGTKSITATTAKTYKFTLSELRYVCSMVQPVNEVLAAWDERYRSEQGLVYHWSSIFCNIQYNDGSQGSIQQVIPCRVASARMILTSIKPLGHVTKQDGVYSNTTGVGASWTADNTGDSVDSGISSYQYIIGVERYPMRAPVRIDDSGSQNLMHVLHCMGRGATNDSLRFDCSALRRSHPSTAEIARGKCWGANVTTMSTKTYLAGDFTKDGFLTGANLRDADLILSATRDSAYPAVYFYHHIVYDTLCRFQSADSGARRYF